MMSAVRGRGLLIAFDLPDAATRDQVWRNLFDRGLLALQSGERRFAFVRRSISRREVVDEAMRYPCANECRSLR